MARTFDPEEMIYSQAERLRDLLSPTSWQRVAMDLTKNEFLAVLYLSRNREARMGDVAEWLRAPLNTATGVIARLERRGYAQRTHSPDDKRVVVVSLTDEGRRIVRQALGDIQASAAKVLATLTPEQIDLLFTTVDQITAILLERGREQQSQPRQVTRIAID